MWKRRFERISGNAHGMPRKTSEGDVIHSYLRIIETASAGLQMLGVKRNAADRGSLYAAFRTEGYTNREAMDAVNRILPQERGDA